MTERTWPNAGESWGLRGGVWVKNGCKVFKKCAQLCCSACLGTLRGEAAQGLSESLKIKLK